MYEFFERLMPAIRDLVQTMIRQESARYEYGAVTKLSPLTVQLDSHRVDAPAVLVSPSSLVAGLAVGMRVECRLQKGRSTVVGRAGGVPFPAIPPFPIARDAPDSSEVLTGDYSLIANWRALATGWYYNNGSMTGMPYSRGLIRVRRRGNEGHATFYAQPEGLEFRLTWNSVTSAVVWEQIGRGLCSGRVTIALPTQGTVGQVSVSLPTNRFSANPTISVAAWSTVPQNVAVSFSTLSTTSFTIHAVRTSGTGDLNVSWSASEIGA